jgi:hypothetical protein
MNGYVTQMMVYTIRYCSERDIPRIHEDERAGGGVQHHVDQVVGEGLEGRQHVVDPVGQRGERAVALVAVGVGQRRPPEVVHQDLPRRVLPVHVRVLDLLETRRSRVRSSI